MDSPLWVLIGFVAGIVIIAFILWVLDPKMTADYDDDGENQPQPNAAASEVRIIIVHWPPPKLHEKLERMVYDVCTEEGSSDGGCAICLYEYCDGEQRAAIDACGHRFHAFCVEAWLRKNNNCPLCWHNLV